MCHILYDVPVELSYRIELNSLVWNCDIVIVFDYVRNKPDSLAVSLQKQRASNVSGGKGVRMP